MRKRVITYGTFDLFHYGHFNLLKRCSKLEGHKCKLYVGVSTDDMCLSKGKETVLKETERMNIVSSLRFVNKVFLEHNMSQKIDDVKKYKIDYFVLGSDYSDVFPKMPESQKLIELGCKVVFLQRTEGVSSTELKKIRK